MRFESRPGYPIYCLLYFVVILGTSMRMLEYDQLLPLNPLRDHILISLEATVISADEAMSINNLIIDHARNFVLSSVIIAD